MASAYPRPPRSSRRRRHASAPAPVLEPERSPLLVSGQERNHQQQPATLEDPGRGIAHPETAESASEQDGGEEKEEEDGEGQEPRREISTDDVLRALDEALTALDADAKGDAGEGARDGPQESEQKEAEEAQRVRSKLRDMVMFRIVSRVHPRLFLSCPPHQKGRESAFSCAQRTDMCTPAAQHLVFPLRVGAHDLAASNLARRHPPSPRPPPLVPLHPPPSRTRIIAILLTHNACVCAASGSALLAHTSHLSPLAKSSPPPDSTTPSTRLAALFS